MEAVAPYGNPVLSAGPSSRGYHRLATYATCPQKGAYRFELALQPLRTADPLALGSLVHLGLMHWYLAKLGREHLDPLEAMRTAPARIAHQFARAREVFLAYQTRYANDRLTVLDVEREVVVKSGSAVHTQRPDLIARLDGRVVVLDHKCQSRISDASVREWSVSGQMIGYEAVGRALLSDMYGLPWGGVVVNFCRTTPPFDAPDSFRRAPLVISPSLLASFPRFVESVNARIDREAALDPWDRERNYEACAGRYSLCEYLPLCTRGQSALHEYLTAADAASDVRAGSGR